MPPRRATAQDLPSTTPDSDLLSPNGPSSSASLTPQQGQQGQGQVQQPRSASPSSGFTQFLSKPSKWFSRSASASKVPQGTSEPRLSSSTGSGGRKPKISRPTDPRPILDNYAGPGSRSVLDLSARGQGSIELSRFHAPSVPSSPSFGPSSPLHHPPNSAGGSSGGGGYALGDLRNVSRKAWSRSADDLNKLSPTNLSPINTSFQDRIAQYRNRSDSAASGGGFSPSSVTSSPTASRPKGGFPISSPISSRSASPGGRHPFPSMLTPGGTTPPSASPPRSSTLPSVSISISAPSLDEGQGGGPVQRTTSPPLHIHTRSHSFTPKLPSKLSGPPSGGPQGGNYPPIPSPQRSGTLPIEGKERDYGDVQGGGFNNPTRTGFGFGFGNSTRERNDSNNNAPSPTSHRATTLLPPPTIIEPGQEHPQHQRPHQFHGHTQSPQQHTMQLPEDLSISTDLSKRSSQIVYHSGFINRLLDVPPRTHLSQLHAALSAANTKGWKGYKMELKGSKLFLYKPPSDKASGVRELFPVGLVPPSEEDAEEEEEKSGNAASTGTGEREMDSERVRRGEGPGLAGGGGTMGRKKRAYWGRRTHPDLVVDPSSGLIEKGTFEALVHEAVFATTSLNLSSSSEGEPSEKEHQRKKWHAFASSILITIPLIVDRQAFEVEFMRCCSYLVSGAESDQKQAEEKKRVEWLIKEYVFAHGKAESDEETWREWCKEVGTDVVSLNSLRQRGEYGLKESTSTRAVVDHRLGSGATEGDDGSPNINTFSPRPDTNGKGRSISLLDALFPSSSSNALGSPQRPNLPTQGNRFPWTVLQEEGLSRDVLLHLDPHLIAISLTLFHRLVLEGCPENLNVGFVYPSEKRMSMDQPTEDLSTLSGLTPSTLFGTDSKPHWLTKLILLQILASEGPSSNGAGGAGANGYVVVSSSNTSASLTSSPSNGLALSSPGRRSEDLLRPQQPHHSQQHPHHHQTSRTHSRSEVISVWAKVGELCRTSGDECTWKAISAALCSRPVARLDKVWKRVDPHAMVAIEGWVFMGGEREQDNERDVGERREGKERLREEDEDEAAFGDVEGAMRKSATKTSGVSAGQGGGVVQPQVTPWGGDLKDGFSRLLARAQGSSEDASNPNGGSSTMLQMGALTEARSLFEGFRTSFALCPRKIRVSEADVDEDIRKMVSFWREAALDHEGAGLGGGLGVKFKRVEQFMSLSLAAEPRRKGLFEPYFWGRPAAAQAPSASLVPLLFPEPLPAVTLVDRSKLVRGRVDSDLSDAQYLRSLDAQLQQEAAGRQLHRFDMHGQVTKKLILGSGGTVIAAHNGELLLVVQAGGFESLPNSRPPSSRVTSRPPSSVINDQSGSMISEGGSKPLSRNPSIRVKPSSSHGLDRKASMARRSSLPSVSHLSRQNFVTSEPSSDPPLRVVVQAGTLNNLVNVLVHGLESISVSVADDNGEMTLREGMTRELVVDRGEFAKVWWNVFRSFVSPFVFFELLRKIFMTAQLAGASSPPSDQLQDMTLRNEVLLILKEWISIGAGAQDILDDAQLFTAVQNFLELSLDQFVPDKQLLIDLPLLQQSYDLLSSTRRQVKTTFLSQTMRPSVRGLLSQQRNHNPTRSRTWLNNGTRELPDFDRMDPEDFVENLDGMAYAAFSNVSQEDLYITADLLEVQTSDRTGWFTNRDLPPSEELVEIQTIYSQIQEIEPSSLISELTQDALYRLLPPGVRSCIRAYAIIRKWLISKLAAPRLGLRARQARMELLLQVIEVARLRNAESADHAIDQPCVRSFVEAVATSAILSVESRLHHRAWQSVALSRGTSCDSLATLLMKPYIQCTASRESLTVDIGWFLERMLEVIATPDIIDATPEEGLSLVNFDKRRHLCNLIRNASCIPSSRKTTFSEESNRRGFERLNNIEKEVLRLQFDHRGIKDEASREAANPGMNGAPTPKKPIRPFHKVVTIQVEKNRRDKNLRARLQREKQYEQSKNDRRDDLLNRAMRPRNKPMPSAQKQHRNKKSMSAFLNFMRPISSAFGADISSHLLDGHKRTPSELDFVPSGKPALVLSIMDAQVAQLINNERSYTFQLDTEDGGHYLLQAISKREMNKWLEAIARVTRMAAKRRLTYIGNSPKPQIADHIHHHPIVASQDPKAVFGVELQFLLQREARSDYIPPGTVPIIIEQCLSEVETRGLTEVGIYRIAGAATEINGLKDAYNRGEYPIKETTDIHAICDVIKSWFRVLPEPLFPPASYRDVMEAMRQDNLDERLVAIRSVVQGLPQANFDLLKRVSEHLDRVTDYEEHNHMTAEALAIVFSPNLLRAPQNDFVMILNNMGLSHKLVKALITHFHAIFDEADPEGEAHSEDELESPILEEEEEDDDEIEDANPIHELNNNEHHSFDARHQNQYTHG